MTNELARELADTIWQELRAIRGDLGRIAETLAGLEGILGRRADGAAAAPRGDAVERVHGELVSCE